LSLDRRAFENAIEKDSCGPDGDCTHADSYDPDATLFDSNSKEKHGDAELDEHHSGNVNQTRQGLVL
jgi:hypothetical protein